MKSCVLLILIMALLGDVQATGTRPDKLLRQASQSRMQHEARSLLERAKKALKTEPRSAFWHNQAAMAYMMLGELSSARIELQRAIEFDPENPIHYYGQATLSKELGDSLGELEALRKALALDPKNPTGRFALADALERSGDLQGALKEYTLSIEYLGYTTHTGTEAVYYDSRKNAYTVGDLRKHAERRIRKLKNRLTPKPRNGKEGKTL